MVRREKRRRLTTSSGKQAWLWLATTASWFFGLCVAWVLVDLSLGVFEYDRSDTMSAVLVVAYGGPIILLVAVADFALALGLFGRPRWARVTALAVGLLVTLLSVAALVLLRAR